MSRSRGGTLRNVAAADHDLRRRWSSSSPAMQLSRVDLPQPEGPTRTRKSPFSMSRLIDFSTSTHAEALLEIADREHRVRRSPIV